MRILLKNKECEMKYISVILSIAFLLLTSCFPGANESQPAGGADQKALAVEGLTVTKGILNEYIEASGVISGINEAFVVSETQGIIRSVNFDLGDKIEKGQVLLQVDNKIQEINLEQAKIEYDNAKLDYNAVKNLFDAGSASQSELNRAESALSGAKGKYEQTLKAYNDCTLQAPISGFIAERDSSIALGNYLNSGTRIARLVDISAFKLEIAVGEREVGLLNEGAEAEIFIPTCSRVENNGAIDAIAAGSDPATGSFPVIITWQNKCPGNVRAGMTASVKIRTNDTTPRVIVPTSSIFAQEGQSYVYISDGGKAVQQPVTKGETLGNRTAVETGLEGGETIIISGITVLRDGTDINPTIVGDSGTWQ